MISGFFGFLFLATGLLGPFTYADDLRHHGELAVVIGLVVSGLCLLAPLLHLPWRCADSLPLASVSTLLGVVVGAVHDTSLLGVLLGACLGFLVVSWHCSRKHRDAT